MLAASQLVFISSRVSFSITRRKISKNISGTKVPVGMNLYKMKTISPTVYQHIDNIHVLRKHIFFNKGLAFSHTSANFLLESHQNFLYF